MDAKFEMQLALGESSPNLAQVLATSKRIELSYRLVDGDGNALGPPGGDWSEILGMFRKVFPTLTAIELSAPFLILQFTELPLTPLPFTIGGLPLRLTDNQHVGNFNPGVLGRGTKELMTINLRRGDALTDLVFEEAIDFMQARAITVHQIFCFDNFWSIVIPDGIDLEHVPRVLAGQACCYKFQSEVNDPDPATLRAKVPRGVDFDDTNYATDTDALLRPGIMVTSSAMTAIVDGVLVDMYKKTTSGILVVDKDGEPFITVATHGFEADGLVYHPNPISGSIIGRIVQHLPGTDISLAKLNPSLRYANQTFGTEANPEGIKVAGISPGYPPHLRRYDVLEMDNPYSGYTEGTVIGVGLKLAGEGGTNYIHHTWDLFENGNEPVDGSCGCPVLDEQGLVVGLFRFKMEGGDGCLAVSAMELRRFNYEISGGETQF